MSEIRLAQKGEIDRQKEIWKLCFGDSDQYIDFYYANHYKEEDTLLLLRDGEIEAMLTMMPIRIVTPDNRSLDSTMLYAIATHPEFRGRGYASQLIEFANQYLRKRGSSFSVLVPSDKYLFDFYRQQGYKDCFYISELSFDQKKLETLETGISQACTSWGLSPREYNLIREEWLGGRLHVAYNDEEIAYQKNLSQMSGADIYAIEIDGLRGCAVIEKLDPDQLLIRELLISEGLLTAAVRHFAELLPGKGIILRTPVSPDLQAGDIILCTPVSLDLQAADAIRAFGMIRINQDIDFEIKTEYPGYLGLAFD